MSHEDAENSRLAKYTAGNELFRAGRHEDAELCYSDGIEYHEWHEGDRNDEAQAVYRKLLLNRSQCRLLLRDYNGAAEDAKKILSLEPSNIKAMFRRAIALRCLGVYTEAAAILEEVLKLRLPENLQRDALKMRSELRAQLKTDSEVKKAEGVPVSFLSEHQVIKLALGCPHIDRMVIGRNYTVRLCLGNKFGLFNKELLPTRDSTPISVLASCFAVDGAGPADQSTAERLCVRQVGAADFIASGKVDFTFSIQEKDAPLDAPLYIMLRFECSSVLASGKAVVPVITLPTLVSSAAVTELAPDGSTVPRGEHLLSLARRIEAHCIREVAVPSNAASADASAFLAFECPGYLGIGGKVWDSTYVLFKYLLHRPQLVRSRRVVEFGSGTGLAGISMACLQPASVCLSDFAHVTGLLSANVELNEPLLRRFMNSQISNDHGLRGSMRHYSVIGYSWGDHHYTPCKNDTQEVEPMAEALSNRTADVFKNCDVAVASDVVYDPIGYEPLFKAILDFLNAGEKSPSRCFIMAHRHRNPEDQRFFDMLDSCPAIEYWEDDIKLVGSKAEISETSSLSPLDNNSDSCLHDHKLDGGGAVSVPSNHDAADRRKNSLMLGKVRIFIVRLRK